tara:strand:+ start:4435 stop:5187 length:753 start_codon:yes stop_codon:yes gene_type:complete
MSKYIANKLFNDKISIYVTECLSTNDFLTNLLKRNKIREGDSVITDYQHKGRGQRNNNWSSERGSNILFSFLLSPDLIVNNQFYLHVIISNAIINSLKKINLEGKVKWPNDIYVKNKKIAGILIESFISGKKVQNSIIGMGINLNQKIFKGLNATSVFIEKKKVTKKNAFIKILKKSLETEYFNFSINMDIRIKKYKKLLYGLNEIKKFKSSSEIFYAKIIDVSQNGDIILNINDKQKSFSHGSISLLED